MERRGLALERSWRRRKARISAQSGNTPPAPPPPPPVDPPPSGSSAKRKPQKRSTYGLQRDYRVLEREKKVTAVLENHGFRTELENILQGQLEGRERPATRPPPDQWQVDLHQRASNQGTRQPVAVGDGMAPVVPINDLGGILASKYTLAERETRCKLAAVYRLVDMFGWTQLIHNHITACAPGGRGGYYVNAFGLLYGEVTASNLLHVSLEGDIIDTGSTQLGVNVEGIGLHSAIHKSRADIKCAIHLHNAATVAISVVNCGLLPISTEAKAVGSVSYYDLWEAEREDWEDEIASILRTAEEKVLVLHNHGAVAMGESIEEAFSVAYNLVKACEIQVAAMTAGIGNLNTAAPGHPGVWRKRESSKTEQGPGGLEWRLGELQFEALMRMLDNKGYRTGYSYKGLGLLQPGKEPQQPAPRNKQDSSNGSDEGTPETAKNSSKARGTVPKTEPWEFLAEDEEIEVPPLKVSRRRLSLSEDDQANDTKSGNRTGTQEDDGLDSLQMVARQVAESTGDAAQKVALKGTDLNLLEITAERVAGSTGEAVHKLKSSPEGAISDEEQGLQNPTERSAKTTPNSSEVEQNLLSMARQTAERVARSTGIAVGKLASAEETREALEYSVELGDPLELTKLTAEHVAKSTNEVVKRLKPNGPSPPNRVLDPTQDILDPTLEQAQDQSSVGYARQMWSTESGSPQQISHGKELLQSGGQGVLVTRTLNGTRHLLHYASPVIAHDESARVLPLTPSTEHQIPLPTPLSISDNAQLGTARALPDPPQPQPLPGPLPSDTQRMLPHPPHLQPLPGPLPSDTQRMLPHPPHPQPLPGPLPSDTPRMLPQPPASIGENTLAFRMLPQPPVSIGENILNNSRQLPLLPQPLPVSVSDNNRTLPAIPESPVGNHRKLPSKQTAAIFTVTPASLLNGYHHHHSPMPVPGRGYVQHSGTASYRTKSLDSDSEYSTTESVELTAQLLTPEYKSLKQAAPTGDTDMKTNPMKRMTHTAEMVAESTGKAVHRLTSTLA